MVVCGRYPEGVEWSDDRHWHCNNNAHPSRHGTYDGISMHPFETVRRFTSNTYRLMVGPDGHPEIPCAQPAAPIVVVLHHVNAPDSSSEGS